MILISLLSFIILLYSILYLYFIFSSCMHLPYYYIFFLSFLLFSLLLHFPSHFIAFSITDFQHYLWFSSLTLVIHTLPLCCLHLASLIVPPILTLLPPSLLLLFCLLQSPSFSSYTLKLYFCPSLWYRVNLYLFPTIRFSFHFIREGQQSKPLPTEGMNENRLVEAIIGRPRVQEARGSEPHCGGGQYCYST